jgi:hypothetical protein
MDSRPRKIRRMSRSMWRMVTTMSGVISQLQEAYHVQATAPGRRVHSKRAECAQRNPLQSLTHVRGGGRFL